MLKELTGYLPKKKKRKSIRLSSHFALIILVLEDNSAGFEVLRKNYFEPKFHSQRTVTQELKQSKISKDSEIFFYLLFLIWLGNIMQEKENSIQQTEKLPQE